MSISSDRLTRLKACEQAYWQIFCTSGREWGLFVYQDRQLKDYPPHNFVRLPEDTPDMRLRSLADITRNTAKATGRDFLRMISPQPLSFKNAQNSRLSYYELPPELGPEGADSGSLQPVTEPEQLEELTALELGAEVELYGRDMCQRRAKRRGQIYLDGQIPLTAWLLYQNCQPAACGQLWLCEGAARISGLLCPEPVRLRLLSALAAQARAQGADLVYLAAEEPIQPSASPYERLGLSAGLTEYVWLWRFTD